ncbi:dynein regulatory complex protein 1 homolog [Condylostylus longicornis]|uniref:dynein regulatory complex protein 1 homolog n=1 Tax=Condylostylus longicornis TaxID=2530218 RepID=UPI00244DAEA4|nr:dynein regulatory complex protein 1 homolog [Condylostylus longicornis]
MPRLEQVSTQAIMLRKVVEKKKLKPLVLELTKRLERLDESKILVESAIEQRRTAAPKPPVDKAASTKTGIEKQLEDSDELLSQLIAVGNELVTNVQVANEKREILRRNFESSKRDALMEDLEKESTGAMARLDEITGKWSELRSIKEPMGLFEKLEEQKQRIDDLMKQKDDIIKECQIELTRLNEDYYIDQIRQNSDIYCLIERVDNQVNLIKNTYNEHLVLLQDTIESERKSVFSKMSESWQDLYNKQTHHETVKHTKQKQKSRFYDNEIARISREQEEITRGTRIRLERDAEALQLELKKVKNTVMMNSEKMDYNYRVLQKRNEENVIVSNQQKRRVSRIMEAINILKKKIKDTKINSEINIKNLTKEIVQLQSNILELEAKAERFRALNEKRYNTVWDMNCKEATELTNKVLDIDRLLFEQQLGLDWVRPNILKIKKSELPFFKKDSSRSGTTASSFTFHIFIQDSKLSDLRSDKLSRNSCKTDDEKLNENLLRNILFKIADRAGFLCEERLLEVLEPYTENQKTLVRIDNILSALNIKSFSDVECLTKYFLPYAYCPNCSDGIQIEDVEEILERDSPSKEKIHQLEEDANIFKHRTDSIKETKLVPCTPHAEEIHETSSQRSGTAFENFSEEIDQKVDTLISKTSPEHELKLETLKIQKSVKSEETPKCANHYLIIEPSLVLTGLKDFAEKHLQKHSGITSSSPSNSETSSNTKMISSGEVKKFWNQFSDVITEEKLKLWKCVEHGLNHYLVTLRDREELDRQCEFLRRQNAELKHLLTRYLPENQEESVKQKE